MSGRPAFLTDAYIPSLFKQVGTAVGASRLLPDSDTQSYLQFSSEFNPAISSLRLHAKNLLLKLVKFVNPQSVSASYDDVVDASDECLEKVALGLDENTLDSAQNQLGRLGSQQLLKYEYPFLKEVDNSNGIFVPKLKRKPNAKVPLDPTILDAQRRPSSMVTLTMKHPYQYEIEHLQLSEALKSVGTPQVPAALDVTPLELVNTPEKFQTLLATLKTCTELAVDLEHHSVRSYQGFVCLMQISTREQDFIVDPLAVWDQMHLLLDIFTDPTVLKVFHGADSDIVWLQRDFGLYVVNMFDTGQAARELKMTSFGLAFLLKRLCHVDTDKSYQLADWRVRPLSSAMTTYARMDTHYLLYIYDKLKDDLVKKGKELHKDPESLLQAVFQKSKEVCLRRFEKPNYTYMGIRRLGGLSYTGKRLLDAIAEWRDQLARRLDESPSFLLTGETVLLLASTTPGSPEELLARIRRPSPLLTHDRVKELVAVINLHREQDRVQVYDEAESETHPVIETREVNLDWLVVTKLMQQAPQITVKVVSKKRGVTSLFGLFETNSGKRIHSTVESVCRSFESLLQPTIKCRPTDMEVEEGEIQSAVLELEKVLQPSTADFIELKVPVETKPLPPKRKARDKQQVRIVPDPPMTQPPAKLKIEMSDVKTEPKLTKRRKLWKS